MQFTKAKSFNCPNVELNSFPLQSFTKFVTVFSSIQQTQAVMVYQINHDEVEMNNIPLITVEPVAELLRSSSKSEQQCHE